MANRLEIQDDVMYRCSALGIPGLISKPFSQMVKTWVLCSGKRWTSKRLKLLRLALIHYRASQPFNIPWLSQHQDGRPKGILGYAFKYATKDTKRFNKIINLLMVHTLFYENSVSEDQKKKFMTGIDAKCIPVADDFHKSLFQNIRSSIRNTHTIERGNNHIFEYVGSPEKRCMTLFKSSSTPQDSLLHTELRLFNTNGGRFLYNDFKTLYRPVINGTSHQRYLDRQAAPYRVPEDYDVIGGKISFIQEPGLKLRSVANPLRIHQMALKPLGNAIYKIVASLPWDCTFDQSKAHPHVQKALQKGSVVHSVDLSNATDFFPLDIQITVLKAMFGDIPDINLFEKISRSSWNSPYGKLQWKQGQPLGLYPSFGSFTMTHGYLLWFLNGCRHNNSFFVVGDDVVILDDWLNNRYLKFLQDHGCPYSPDKTISSNILSEFAGKIILSDAVIPQYKWREMSDNSFLDICKNIGSGSRRLLSKRQKRVFDLVAYLLPPIGLGFSKPGDDYLTCLERTQSLLDKQKIALGSIMGLKRKFNHLLYGDFSHSEVCPEILGQISDTFDEKVRRVMKQTLFHNFQTVQSMIDGFDRLPDQLGLADQLPMLSQSNEKQTTLIRYERMISMQFTLTT